MIGRDYGEDKNERFSVREEKYRGEGGSKQGITIIGQMGGGGGGGSG